MSNRREREKRDSPTSNSKQWGEQSKKGTGGSTAIKLPEGVEFYKLTVGKQVVDFMPFLAGKGNPRADEGFQHFEREFTDHRVPTPDGKSAAYLCLWANYKESCPICKVINDKNTDPDLKKALKPTLRHLWLINDKPGDEDNTLKVFVSNHYNKKKGFGEQMAQICADQEEGEDFSDLENGKSVKMEIEEETGGGFKYNLVTRIDLVNRKHEYSADLIDKMPCLDDMLMKPDPKELEKLLNLGSTDDTEEEPELEYEAPKSSAKKSPTPVSPDKYKGDEEGEVTAKGMGITLNSVVDHEEYGTCTVVHISSDGTALRLKDSDGEIYKGVETADCELVDSSEDVEEKPVAKKATVAKPSKKSDPDFEDDDLLDSEDDEPTPAKKPSSKKPVIDEDEDNEETDSELDDFDSELDEPEEAPKKAVRQSKR